MRQYVLSSGLSGGLSLDEKVELLSGRRVAAGDGYHVRCSQEVQENEELDLGDETFAAAGPVLGQMARTVDRVCRCPFVEGFLTVEENDLDAPVVAVRASKQVGFSDAVEVASKLEQNRARDRAVDSSLEALTSHHFAFVVGSENQVLVRDSAGHGIERRNEVGKGHLAHGRVVRKLVLLDLPIRRMLTQKGLNVGLNRLMARRAYCTFHTNVTNGFHNLVDLDRFPDILGHSSVRK